MFLHPAGMTRLESNEVSLGTAFLFGDIEFNVDPDNAVSLPPGQTHGGDNIGAFVPIGSAYSVIRFGWGSIMLVVLSLGEVSKQQIEAFRSSLGFANNRPVQPVNTRVVITW